jgi:hypothetical protein
MQSASPPLPLPPPWWVQWAPVLVVAGLFGGTLSGGFLADDFVYIARFQAFPWSDWPGLFLHEWSGGVWGSAMRELRPISALSLMIDARLWGGEPAGYRLTNLLLHALASWLVLRVAWQASRGQIGAALAAGLIFAVHPAHAEPVLWITGRTDMLATCLGLGFWLLAGRYTDQGRPWQLGAASVALTAGLFSKELCAALPFLLLIYWAVVDPAAGRTVWLRRVAVLAGTALVLGIYWWCRHVAFGHEGTGHDLWTDLPSWERQAGYLGWLAPILPFMGRLQWAAVPSLTAMHAIFLAFAALSVVAAVWLAVRRHRRGGAILFFGALWYLVAVPPLLAVVYFSPRHLYFPSVGLAVAVGLAVGALRSRGLFIAATTALVLWAAAALLPAMQTWRHAGKISREALAAVERESAGAPPGTVAFVAVPETAGEILLWAWASPQVLGAPFLSRPFAPELICEREGNYYRPAEVWRQARAPLISAATAPAAVALYVSPAGEVSCRRVMPDELAARTPALAAVAADGISTDEWTAWVKSLAKP